MSEIKEFKSLRGNIVFVSIPKKEESKLIVDENTKEALQKEMLKKMSKLVVYAVGDLVTDIFKDDVVLIDPIKLKNAPLISLSEDNDVLMISLFDIILVWH